MAIDTSFFVSSLSEGIREEGRVQGRDEGRAQGRATSIVQLLEARDVPVSDTERQRIMSCTDLDTLTHWFDRAVTATTTAELFTEDSAA